MAKKNSEKTEKQLVPRKFSHPYQLQAYRHIENMHIKLLEQFSYDEKDEERKELRNLMMGSEIMKDVCCGRYRQSQKDDQKKF